MHQGNIVGSDVELDGEFTKEQPGSKDSPLGPICSFSGQVVHIQGWSETAISGGGTTGYGQYMRANPITVQTLNATDFWVRRSDGREEKFVIDAHNAEFRPGHEVTVTYFEKNTQVAIIYNHASRKYITCSRWTMGARGPLFVVISIIANIIALAMYEIMVDARAYEFLFIPLLIFCGNYVFYAFKRDKRKFDNSMTKVSGWIGSHASKPVALSSAA